MPPSFQLLITILRAGLHTKSKQGPSSVISQASDKHWQKFLDRCDFHNVSNLARSSLRSNDLWELLPEFVQQTLEHRYHNTVAWSLKLRHALEQVIPLFDQAGIPIIPWKGPSLSQRLFDTVWDREYSDLDFLISAQHQSAAEILLNELDYHINESELAENPPSLANNNDHCRSYQHSTSNVMLEVHNKPFPTTFRFTQPGEPLLADTTFINFHSVSIRQLSLEDEFLLLLAHGAKHHWSQLNWLYDFAFFTKRYSSSLDWEKITLRSKQLGCHRILKITWALCEQLLALPIPNPQLSRPTTDPTACHLAATFSAQLQSPKKNNRLKWKYLCFKHSLLSRERYRDRLPVILSSIAYAFSPNNSDRNLCPQAFPLSLCAWLIRPFRLVRKYVLHLGDKTLQ